MTPPAAPWRAFYENTPPTLTYPSLTVYQLVSQTARENPHITAYEFMNRRYSYACFLQRVDRAAAALYHLGIRRGDRVTICMPNMPQAVDCFYALSRLGAVANMVHPLSATEELKFYFDRSDSKAVLTADLFYEKVHTAAMRAKRTPILLVARITDELNPVMRLGYRLTQGKKQKPLPKDGSYRLWADEMKNTQPIPEDVGRCEECAAILYSGGTTGTTKGICLSSYSLNALALQTLAFGANGSYAPGFTMLAIMPLFHGFGLGIGVHTALVGGGTSILVPLFSIQVYANVLKKKKPQYISGVPTLFEALLRTKGLEKLDMSFLRGVFSGGDSLPVPLKEKVDAFLRQHHAAVQIREGYGATESVTASCLTPATYARPGSVGIPFPDIYYTVVKPGTTQPVPVGEEGELCLTGPTLMMGYLDEPEETALALQQHADGLTWLHSGDLGRMDEDGFVYFCQRIKRIIVVSGYNVYPSQLESVLDSHPAVQQSCIIGVPDSYKMHKIKAFVVLKAGIPADDRHKEDILAYCRERIARYAMPYDIEFRESLPKTLVGKIAYRELEEEEAKKAQ